MKIDTSLRGFSQPLQARFFIIIVTAIFLPLLAFFLFIRGLEINDLILIAWQPGQELLTTGKVSADYPYPLWTVIIMLPFALLDPKQAMSLWLVVNLILLIISLKLFTTMFDWEITAGVFSLLVFSFVTYFPVLVSLDMGQLSVFSLFVLALTIHFFLNKKWAWLGIALGLSFIKPQVMPLLTGLLLLWALSRRHWQVLLGFGGVVTGLILISLPFISNPWQIIGGGIGGHLSTYIKITATLWALFMSLGATWHVPFIISIILLVWVGWLWKPFLMGKEVSANRARFLFSIAIIVNLLIIPYSWIYNLALLLVPFMYSLSLALKMKKWQKIIWTSLLFATMNLLTMVIVSVFNYEFDLNHSQAYHTIHALVLLFIMTYLEYRRNSQPNSTSSAASGIQDFN